MCDYFVKGSCRSGASCRYDNQGGDTAVEPVCALQTMRGVC